MAKAPPAGVDPVTDPGTFLHMEDPTTQELRIRQSERQREESRQAEEEPSEEGTEKHARRAEKADYLRRKLEERARAEREAGRR
jgi:hypothetical protein